MENVREVLYYCIIIIAEVTDPSWTNKVIQDAWRG